MNGGPGLHFSTTKLLIKKKKLKCQYGLRPCWELLGLCTNRHLFLFLTLSGVYSNFSILTLLLWILEAAEYHINPLVSALKNSVTEKKLSAPESKNWSVGEFQQLRPVQTAFSQQVNYIALDKSLFKNYNQIETKVWRVQLNVSYFLLQAHRHMDQKHKSKISMWGYVSPQKNWSFLLINK